MGVGERNQANGGKSQNGTNIMPKMSDAEHYLCSKKAWLCP